MSTMPIGQMLTYWAKKDPSAPCVTFEGQTISREVLETSSNKMARAYQELGVKQGDFVTIGLPNGIEFYVATFAVWKLGATPQPVSAKLPVVELQGIVKVANPSLIVGVEPDVYGDIACVPQGYTPNEDLSDKPLPPSIAKNWKAPTSGGSTGRPKIIVATEAGEFDPLDSGLPFMDITKPQIVPGPLYHNASFSFSTRAIMSGCHVVLMPRFEAENTLMLIEQYQVGSVVMVPTMMQRIWRLPKEVRVKYDLSSLSMVLHLGAPCPLWLKEEWINWLGAQCIHELYGGTEGQSVTWITGEEWLAHKGSVGRPAFGEMKVFDKNHQELPAGKVGEIFLRAPEEMKSNYQYLGDEIKTIGDGWESLGDMGYTDEDGYLYLVDRQTDMILSGGANIYPAEVEAAIDAFPGVRSSVVIGLPNEDMGNLVHGIIDAPKGIDEKALLTHLSELLVRYKIPRTFEYVDQPLRDDAGKVRRSRLREDRIALLEK